MSDKVLRKKMYFKNVKDLLITRKLLQEKKIFRRKKVCFYELCWEHKKE